MSNSRWTHLVGAVDVNFRLDDGHEPAADHARRELELLRHDSFDTDRVVPSNHAPSLGAEDAVAGGNIGAGNALLNKNTTSNNCPYGNKNKLTNSSAISSTASSDPGSFVPPSRFRFRRTTTASGPAPESAS